MNLWTSVGFCESIYIIWKRWTQFNYHLSMKSLQEPKLFLIMVKLTKPGYTILTFVSLAHIKKCIHI